LRDGSCCLRENVRDGRCLPPSFCPPDTIRLNDGQCCDRSYARDGRCFPPNSCPPGQIKVSDGQCCDRRYVKDGSCVPPNNCPPGQIKLSDGCCPRENVRDGSCVVLRREIHPPLRRLRVYEPREPREPDDPVPGSTCTYPPESSDNRARRRCRAEPSPCCAPVAASLCADTGRARRR
jgi:hypothetical protein